MPRRDELFDDPIEYNSDDEYHEEMDEVEEGENYNDFVAEVNAYERVMYNLPEAVAAIQGPQMTGKLGEIQRKLTNMTLRPRDRFILQVNASYNSMSESGIISLSDGEIDIILNHVDKIQNAEYKNPTAYILGYMANYGSSKEKLVKKNVQNVMDNILPKIQNDANIGREDIIRYARLWQLS